MKIKRYNSQGDLIESNIWFEDGSFVCYDLGLEMSEIEAYKMALNILDIDPVKYEAKMLEYNLGLINEILKGEPIIDYVSFHHLKKLLEEYKDLRSRCV